ncbi:unnamed protein product [Macrosiphum euphorbiae]|uniref:Uncharacterized protein n=1 Tax=Macrosiphum euphorbiae TaxID=13131 RepID=A0AAV0WRK3_9HEMI|nr:unnamed protein product [Macrosiphum euphorbiae]
MDVGEGGPRRRRLGITRSAVLPKSNCSHVDATVSGVAVSSRPMERGRWDCGGCSQLTMIAKPRRRRSQSRTAICVYRD